MYDFLKQDDKLKLKGLAYYQIAGGIFGIGALIFALAQAGAITGLLLLLYILAFGLYSFSIFCGQQLLKGNLIKGLKISTINQVIQTIQFAVFGISFQYISGFGFTTGFDITADFKFVSTFSLSEFICNVNYEKDLAIVGINIVAIIVLYFIENLKRKIKTGSITEKQ